MAQLLMFFSVALNCDAFCGNYIFLAKNCFKDSIIVKLVTFLQT
jgi:hypothetical protein